MTDSLRTTKRCPHLCRISPPSLVSRTCRQQLLNRRWNPLKRTTSTPNLTPMTFTWISRSTETKQAYVSLFSIFTTYARVRSLYLCNILLRSLYLCNILLRSLYLCNILLRSLYLCNILLRSLYLCNILLRSLYVCNILRRGAAFGAGPFRCNKPRSAPASIERSTGRLQSAAAAKIIQVN
jgi:hypothetical protein